MKGKTFIDGTDIYAAYGALVTEGGYNGLVQFPSLKTVEYNDWYEEDGIEADLSNPVLDTKNVSVSFAFVGMRMDPFIKALSDAGYHTFEFREIGRTFRLRLVSAGNPTVCGGLRLVTLTFADDFPLDGYEYIAPEDGKPDAVCLIDGRSLSVYGVRILEGTRAQVEKMPAVKTALLRNMVTLSGAIYDSGSPVRYRSQYLTLYCLMRSSSLESFWKNHDALLYDLTRQGERRLDVEDYPKIHECYYKSMGVQEFSVTDGSVWMKFTLLLTSARQSDKISCYATGIWIDRGTWWMKDKWKMMPDTSVFALGSWNMKGGWKAGDVWKNSPDAA